ncbi:hypothetical protein RchiOBHm_Chr5g0014321 [Rosa chinensis]|uniref:KIB1-4 beta-propeller domain-containing protein n=1 Tax=Rosa chinensis TaxID=74649 RepID=A0A2P6Q5M0_ROSCH|nr:hypothetical protein RchiOBHm_Chr5g0014321 [Rosa chinensis]
MRLLHPITNWQLRLSITQAIKELQWSRPQLYSLKYAYTKIDVTYVNKVVVLPVDHLSLGEDFVVFMIYRGRPLAVMRYGDESWIRVDENNSHYDLIVHKGQCFVVTAQAQCECYK